MERALDHIAFVPPNKTSRVRYLLMSIQSEHPMICSCKTTINADAGIKNNFEQAADFFLTNGPKEKTVQNHQISAINTKRGKIKVGPKRGVELRYYKRKEWLNLSEEQREECMEIRRQQLEKRKASDDDESQATKIAALETRIKEQDMKIAALTSSNEDSENSVSLPPPTTGNVLEAPSGFTQRKQKE